MVVSIIQCLLGGLTVWITYEMVAFAGFLAFSKEKFGYYFTQIALLVFIVISAIEVFYLVKIKKKKIITPS